LHFTRVAFFVLLSMRKYWRTTIPILLMLVLNEGVRAQSDTLAKGKDTLDYYELSLEQLLKIKAHGVPSELEKLVNQLISVASKKPLNTRESPSIVSLITEEEIKRSGARDLIDVLRLVPGFDFGVDVEGVVGLGLRGNWAHEGKILVLLDGQETNEILFATTQLGNHYPIEQIKRLEIIRGPGSSIYGGFAEYGVINIITKQGDDINGAGVSATYGRYAKDMARQNVNLMLGRKQKDFEYSLSGMMGQASRSDQTYTDFSGNSYNMSGNSGLNPRYLNAGLAYKNLSFRAIGDFYTTTMRDGYGSSLSGEPVTSHFNSAYTELKYLLKVNEKLTITPRLNYKRQTPWQSESYEGKEAYNKTASRATANLTSVYNVSRHLNVVAGAEYYQDKAKDNADSSAFSNGEQTVDYYNYAFFVQGLVKTRPVNIILGARYDKHNVYGQAFVPRVGLTKRYGRFHFKALYSGSFKAPAIENINYSTADGIKPELTQVAELELGYQLTRKSIFTVNVFDITTTSPIVYFTDSLNNDLYTNSGGAGTQGIEAEYRIKAEWGHINLNYAYYTAANKNKIADYEVEEDKASLTGFANHKANISASWNVLNSLSLNPTVSFYGRRWAYSSVDSSGTSVLQRQDPVVLVNLFLWYKSPVRGLTVGVGGYDLLNQKYSFIQPYNGYHAPLPGPSREFLIRVQYTIHYKK
jgi:outer membrane receptor for ferrienterochelin and colicin